MATTDPAAAPGWYPTAYGWQWWDGRQWYPPQAGAAGFTDEKTLAVLSHLGPLFGGFILPLVMFLIAKDKPYVRHHACEALNFAILQMAASFVAMFALFAGFGLGGAFDSGDPGIGFGIGFGLGFLAFFAVIIASYVFAIMGAVKASRMEWWRYPINIRLVKP